MTKSSAIGRTVLQITHNSCLNIASAQLASIGMQVIGIVAPGELPPLRTGYVRWLELDFHQSAARPLIEALFERADIVLGENAALDQWPLTNRNVIHLNADPAEPLIGAVRAGIPVATSGDQVTCSPLIDIIAGQALAIRALAGLVARSKERLPENIDVDAEMLARELIRQAGGHTPAIPPAGRFATLDGAIFVMAGSDDIFPSFARIVARLDILEDFRYKTPAARLHNGPALHGLLTPLIAEETTEYWLEKLERYGIPACQAPQPANPKDEQPGTASATIALDLGFRLEQIAAWEQRGVIGNTADFTPGAIPTA